MISEEILNNDLTNITGIDAVVSSVNNRLRHGSGVARHLSQFAGSDYEKSCQRLLRSRGGIPVPIGTAHLMNAGDLAHQGVKHIISACAMGYTDSQQRIPATKKSLMSSVEKSLDEANTAGCRNILFPLMCANAGGLNPLDSARWTVEAARKWIAYNPNRCVTSIGFNAFNFRDSTKDYEVEWRQALDRIPLKPKATKYLDLLERSNRYDAAARAVEDARRVLFEGADIDMEEQHLVWALDAIADAKWMDKRRSDAEAVACHLREALIKVRREMNS